MHLAISSPFLKDVINIYSTYFSRNGSPDFDATELINPIKLENNLNTYSTLPSSFLWATESCKPTHKRNRKLKNEIFDKGMPACNN